MLDKNLVKPGDLLLWRVKKSTNLFDRLVGFFQIPIGEGGTLNKLYHHVAICENNEYLYESVWPKTRRSKIPYDQEELELWRVYRAEEVPEGKTEKRYEMAIWWLQHNLGKWYNVIHLFSFGILKPKGKETCGEFVTQAYWHAGIKLANNVEADLFNASPNEIAEGGACFKVI